MRVPSEHTRSHIGFSKNSELRRLLAYELARLLHPVNALVM